LDILSALGGLRVAIGGGFSVIVLIVSKKFFENDILGELFLVKKRDEHNGDFEDMTDVEPVAVNEV